MALSTRELYLVLRAKNQVSAAFGSLTRDLNKARDAAVTMGLESQKAHLQSELAALRHSKATQEFAQRQLSAEKATLAAAVATQKGRQATVAYATSMLDSQKATQNHEKSVLANAQAFDQQRIATLTNEKAFNDLRAAQLRLQAGNDAEIQSLRARSTAARAQIIDIRDQVNARQLDINQTRDQLAATQRQIDQAKVLGQSHKAVLLQAEQAVRGKQEEINASQRVISGMRNEVAERENGLKSISREIQAHKEANVQRQRTIQTLRDSGSAAVAAGSGMTVAGAGALYGMWQLTQAAVAYEKQTAKTLTQVDDTGVSLKQLGKIGLDVAKDFGVTFEDIQEGFFDIFSSMDVNVPQATALLRAFSKAAIAGTTDIKTAGSTTIGIMNAWKIPISQVTHVLDTQFKIVKEGRITYEQMSGTIGRSIPSAVKAGQSFSTLGSMVAFMTRRSATAAQAVTSAGRALDLIANPKVGDRLAKMGIQVRDSAGNFRPLANVVVELQQKLSGLNPLQRAKEIDALFKGSGNNIQARRFWDLVLASKNGAQSFKDMTTTITQSGGSLEKAYGTMADTMAVRSQKVSNQWMVLKVTLGETLFPVLEKLLGYIGRIIEWFDKLSPTQQKWIAWGTVLGAVLLVVVGVLAVFVGSIMVLAAGLAAVGGVILSVIAVVGLFIGAWILAYNKVGWFHDAVNAYFGAIKTAALWLWNNGIKPAFEGIKDAIQAAWNHIQTIFNAMKTAIRVVGDVFSWLNTNIIQPVWRAIQAAISAAWTVIQAVWSAIQAALRVLGAAFSFLYTNFVQPAWRSIKVAIDVAWAAIQIVWGLIQIAIKSLGAGFSWLYTNAVKPAWDAIRSVISVAWNWIKDNVFNPIMAFIHGPMATAWNWLYTNGIKPAWDKIRDILSTGWNWIKDNVFNPISNFISKTIPTAFQMGVTAIQAAWNKVKEVARIPVKFVVEDVLNNGLLNAYNKLAKTFNVHPQDVHVAMPFAKGGPVGSGRGSRDDVRAMLTRGEHVLTTDDVGNLGGHQGVEQIRKMASEGKARRTQGAGPDWLAPHRGGDFDPIGWVASAIKALDPLEAFKNLKGLFNNLAGGKIGEVAGGAGRKIIDGLIEWGKDKFLGGGDAGAGTWAAKTSGWPGPYGNGPPWAANTAGAADMIRGKFPGQSAGSYVSPHGWSDHFPKAIDAMTNAGTPGGLARGNAMVQAFVQNSARYGLKYLIWNRRFTQGQGWGPYSGTDNPHTDHVHASFYRKGGRVARQLMDQGGILRPGMTNVLNGTGGPERVLSMAQTQSFDQLVRTLSQSPSAASGLAPTGGFGRGGGRPIVVNVYTNEIDPRRHALMLGQELDRQIGG